MSQEQTEPEQVEDNIAEQIPADSEPIALAVEPAEEPAGESAEQPAVEPEEEPAEAPAQEPVLEPADEPVDEPASEPTPESELSEPAADLTSEPVVAEDSPQPAVVVAKELPRWPFVVYDIVWLAFSGAVAWLLSLAPKDVSAYSQPVYPLALFAGVGLAICGPVLAFSVWISARRAPWRRPGMFASAMFAGALATLIGVVLWWAGLSVGDFLRLR